MKTAITSLLVTGLLLGAAPAPATAQAFGPDPDGPSLVVLVRHAERAGPSADDPGLTDTGAQRSRDLARLLEDAGITRIHSSDTRRTRETALPLARQEGLEIEIYDHRNLEAFAAALLTLPGRHLVVGHSNTTDEMSVLLGGASHGPIVEAWEDDRIYFLTPRPDEGMETVMLRFGPVSERP
jgi:2,3-bisphosphoglycerate-dependent phosphoglycerate mutase